MKKIFTLLLSCLTFSILCSGQIPTEGLVGYYPFYGNTMDESGSGNDLLNYGVQMVADKNGLADNACFFDNNTLITAPDSNMFYDLSTSFSISLSYSASGLKSSWPTLINKLHANGTTFTGFYLGIDSSRNVLRFRIGDSYIETPSALNQWKQVVISYGNGSIKLYMNGILKSSKLIADQNQANKENFTIGKQSQAQSEMKGTSFFTGYIDEIRIYNRILTQAEVDLLYYDFSTDFAHSTEINPINIYPNPATDHLIIDLKNYKVGEGYTLKITNPMGQIIYKSGISQQNSRIDLPSHNAKGVYFLTITDPQSQVLMVRKIVLQ